MRKPAMSSANTAPVAGVPPSSMVWLTRLIPGVYTAAMVLMILALARPQWGIRQMVVDATGINIVLAVDLSESMAALDFKQGQRIISRLDAVKQVVRQFVQGRNGDRIGLVVFGSQAYTQLPLTRDYDTIVTMLDRLKIGSAGRSTAVGDALGIALKRLEDIDSPSNVIVLLTDGRSNSGEFEPLAAAAIARGAGVKVYTIGVGTKGRAPFLIDSPVFGKRYVYQTVDLDEDTLQRIANETGGLYFRAEHTEALQKIYETIDRMERSTQKVKRFARFDDLYAYCLVPAFVLLGAWVLLNNTRFLKIP